MKPRSRYYLVSAIVAFFSALIGAIELFDGRRQSEDWHGPAWLLIALVWVLLAHRNRTNGPTKWDASSQSCQIPQTDRPASTKISEPSGHI